MLIGQQTGPTSNYSELIETMKDQEEVRRWNHGMPTPASYERAVRAIKMANEENRLIIVFVDTPGADPTEESEAGGIAWRIGETMQGLVESSVPTLAVIINRACSGGAIALTGCDVVIAMEYSTYLVITPEACSSILFHTRSRANEAAEASRITSKEGFELGIVDELIPEHDGPAHRFPQMAVLSLQKSLEKHVGKLIKIPSEDIFFRRIERWSNIGHWDTEDEETIQSIQRKTSRLPSPSSSGFIHRHKGCYSEKNIHRYDPVSFEKLKANNNDIYVWNHHFDWENRNVLRSPWYSSLSQGQGISLLVRAHKETGELKYLEAAEKAFEAFKRETKDGGVSFTDDDGYIWFEEAIVDPPPTHTLNGFIWSLWFCPTS